MAGETYDQLTLLIAARRTSTTFDAPNLLTTTLTAPAATMPFALEDWPTPAKPRTAVQGAAANPLGSTLSANLTPFSQDDWRTPSRARTQTQAWSYNPILSTLTTVTDAPASESATVVRPLPQAPRFDPPNLLIATLGVVVAVPFTPTDWPTPTRRTPPTLTIAQGRPFSYSEGKPPHQDEWPAPPRLRRTITFEPPNLLHGTLTPPSVTMPFSQAEWPVVVRAKRPTETIAQARPAYYDEGKPVHRDDWITPGRLARPTTFEPANLLQGTLTPPTVTMPFGQSDWPVGVKPKRATVPCDPPALVQNTLSGTPTPFVLLEWSLPIRRPSARAFEAVNLPLSTLLPPPPIRMLDWPIPRRASKPALSWTQERPFFYAEPTETAPPLSLLGSYVAVLEQRGSYMPTIELRGSKG